MATYSDFDLNFKIHPVTKDIIKIEDDVSVKRAVINLVLTSFYEKPFHPEIGCGAGKLLFENVTPLISIQIQRTIADVLRNYEPRIRLEDILVKPDIDNNRYEISIRYTILNKTNVYVAETYLQKVR